MNVCYHGPLRDYSGMGEANRHAVAALHTAGVNVQAKLLSYVGDMADFGGLGELITSLIDNEANYKIKIIHTTPDQFKLHLEPNKYHVGHFFWETDRVPKEFAKGLNLMDEIWTGSEASKQAIIAGGVDKPIYIFPQATETEREWPKPYEIPDFKGFLFYSIFEWIDRKNPAALLNAYWSEFQKGEKVGLLLKTYFRNFTLANKKMIREQIDGLKQMSGLKEFPPVFLYLELMDRYQVMRIHKTGDCFVSAHRGEGWGVPQVEAMLAGNPIISTNYGGVHEYLDANTAFLVPAKMVPVSGMEHSQIWYGNDQNWAEVDQAELRKAMRANFDNPEKVKSVKNIGKNGETFVKKHFNFKVVGQEMAVRLAKIEEGL